MARKIYESAAEKQRAYRDRLKQERIPERVAELEAKVAALESKVANKPSVAADMEIAYSPFLSATGASAGQETGKASVPAKKAGKSKFGLSDKVLPRRAE